MFDCSEFLEKHECDYVVMINTTSPLLKVKTIKHFCSLVRKNNFDTILSTVSEKAEVFFQKKPLNFNIFEKVNSQKIQPVDIVVWALTAWKRNVFLNFQREKQCPVFSGRLGFYSIPKDEACDLDNEQDWRIAEGILEARKKNAKIRFFEIGNY